MQQHPSQIIRRLYAGVDRPSFDQLRRLDKLKRNCMEFPDAKYWYLVLEVGEHPKVSWRHNTVAHLGERYAKLSYEDYLELVHPAWRLPYYSFGAIAYTISAQHPQQLQKRKVTFVQQVPLLKEDGEYYWYDQVVIPGAINAAGQMTSHLNFYRELGRCRNHLPAWPVVYSGGLPDPEINAFFQYQRQELYESFLKEVFTDKQGEFLDKYRKLPAVLKRSEPNRQDAYRLLGMSKSNYDKTQLRIKEQRINWFEEFATPSVSAFAIWLNDFFGPPDLA
ncbi:MAG: hypothetical protein AAGA31_12380 [Bacteroidota bacterium]